MSSDATNKPEVKSEKESEDGCFGFLFLGVLAFGAYWWFYSPHSPMPNSANSIAHSDVQKLVGLSYEQVLHRIGKPFSVSLEANDWSIPKECASECDEEWSYYDAVIHEASGTTMDLLAFMNDGKCVFVKVR